MSLLGRRVARMERERPPVTCRRCHGKWMGVHFTSPAPGDYDGPGAPLPLSCPDCGRRMPKAWIMGSRKDWDSI